MLATLKNSDILHFAPEKRLSRLIEGVSPARYIRADLYPSEPGIEKVDMLNITYEAGTFDVVIANHFLEHVSDDLIALSELHRVLKRGGIAILQTPYSIKLRSTLQDSGIDNDLARLHVYGQEDHVRLYGSDIFSRFSSSGLIPDVHTHSETLADIDYVKYGVNPREPLFLFRKS